VPCPARGGQGADQQQSGLVYGALSVIRSAASMRLPPSGHKAPVLAAGNSRKVLSPKTGFEVFINAICVFLPVAARDAQAAPRKASLLS